jgi:CBS domain-containing protein
MKDRIRTLLDHKGHHVETVARDATVCEAVQRMNERRIGSVLVGDSYRPGEPYRAVGIFTERDVLVRVVACGLDPKTTRVAQVMTPDPITIAIDATVADAMQLVTEKRCRHLPVIDDVGLCGLISIGDLTKWLVHDQELTIEDLHLYIQRG